MEMLWRCYGGDGSTAHMICESIKIRVSISCVFNTEYDWYPSRTEYLRVYCMGSGGYVYVLLRDMHIDKWSGVTHGQGKLPKRTSL